jgi:predicted metal-dependent peptidase
MTLDLQKLSAAKLWLISTPVGAPTPEGPRDLAYLAQALYALIPVRNDDVPRMTCDEWWRIYINARWLNAASLREVAEELAHLVWHLLSDHAGRARNLGVDRSTIDDWTRAADITVSHTLDPELLRPDRLPTWRGTRLGPGRPAEEYFAVLSGLRPTGCSDPGDDGRPGGCGSGADGLARHDEYGTDTDIGAVSGFEAREIRRRVAIEFRDRQLRRGTAPGDLLRWVENVLQPETPWEPILTAAVRRAVGWAAGRGDYTYARPSRRSGSVPGIVLPGQHRPVPRVAVIVDTPGSVDDTLLQRALAEVDGVIEALGIPGSSITFYSVDVAVHTTEKLRSAANAKLIGAGGTDLRIGLAAVQAERPRPDVVIVLTDGGTPWPATPPPGAVVIVALLGRKGLGDLPPTPAWAVRIECLLSEW